MTRTSRLLALFGAALILPACGSGGTKTIVVAAGPATIAGVVVPGSGSAAGVTVFLHLIDSDLNIALTRDVTITDASGGFLLSAGYPASPGTRFLLEAIVLGESYFRITTGSTGQTVDPATTGVYKVVRLVVETPAERSIFHYTDAELATLYAQATADLVSGATDLSDPDAVRDRVLTATGGLIADLSEGAFAPTTLVNPVASNPPDATASSSVFLTLTDGGGQIWDIQSSGYISNGSIDAYDGAFFLNVGGAAFPSQGTAVTQDGRELVLGPSVMSALNVTRKIYIDDVAASLSYARFLEILNNPTGAPITVTVLISGNMGSDEGNNLVTNSSSGDTTASAADFWFTNHQQASDPALGFLFPGATSVTKTFDNFTYSFQNVVVPANTTVTILHWAFQNTGAQPAAVQEIEAFLGALTAATDIPAGYFRGLSQAEVVASLVPIAGDGVSGGAGSVAPFATVTATNTATGESIVRPANPDGSFRIIFGQFGASSGDSITVTATDGTNATLPFP